MRRILQARIFIRMQSFLICKYQNNGNRGGMKPCISSSSRPSKENEKRVLLWLGVPTECILFSALWGSQRPNEAHHFLTVQLGPCTAMASHLGKNVIAEVWSQMLVKRKEQHMGKSQSRYYNWDMVDSTPDPLIKHKDTVHNVRSLGKGKYFWLLISCNKRLSTGSFWKKMFIMQPFSVFRRKVWLSSWAVVGMEKFSSVL